MSLKADQEQVTSAFHPLEISIAQIRNAMASSDDCISRLSADFVEVASLVDMLIAEVEDPGRSHAREQMADNVRRIREILNGSLQSFQFYDRLVQRMNHVIIVLEQLTDCMVMKAGYSEQEIYDRILSCFTLEDEKALLRSIFKNTSWQNATNDDNKTNENKAVELF